MDGALELSRTYGIREIDFGHALIFFLLHVILGLFDGILEDWDLQFESFDKQSSRYDGEVHQVMDIDAKNYSGDARHENHAILLKANSLMTFEALEKITANKKAKVFLRLIKFNMYALTFFFFNLFVFSSLLTPVLLVIVVHIRIDLIIILLLELSLYHNCCHHGVHIVKSN